MAIATINPATGELVRRFEPHSGAEIDRRLERATTAFRAYRRTDVADRGKWLARAANLLDAEREALARLMVLEMGKTIRSARSEVEKCGLACRYYAERGGAMIATEPAPGGTGQTTLAYLPIGPVLAVMPWNFPFWQVIRFAAPALMAGNVGLLKHASNVPQCALALEDLFGRAGFPPGVFQTLLIGSEAVDGVIADPRVAAVTLTGSEAAGAAVATTAGKHLKKTVLELGGSDPFIVMPSADLDRAIETAVTARVINNGQSCIAAKRFIVHDLVYDRFARGMIERLAALKIGDPMREATDVGPLATESGRQTVARQVDESVAAGARLLLGGKLPSGPGYYYPPTALGDIPPAAPAHDEEVFGPVALLHRARDLDHAIVLANDSGYGLGSSVWTADPAEQSRFVREVEAGMTFVNTMVASDPRLPFGGVKRSGHGRELGWLGIREFVNIKTVVIAPGTRSSEVE